MCPQEAQPAPRLARLGLAVSGPAELAEASAAPREPQRSRLLPLQPPLRARFSRSWALMSLEKSMFFTWAQHLAAP